MVDYVLLVAHIVVIVVVGVVSIWRVLLEWLLVVVEITCVEEEKAAAIVVLDLEIGFVFKTTSWFCILNLLACCNVTSRHMSISIIISISSSSIVGIVICTTCTLV